MCKKENSQLDEHFRVRSNLKSIQSLLTFVSMYFAFHMKVYVYVFVLIADICIYKFYGRSRSQT